MSVTAQDVMTEAAALLNDPSQSVYTNAVQLPLVAKANRELQILLEVGGIPTLKETSTVLPVLTGAVTVASPVDLIEPIKLQERASGSATGTIFDDMIEEEWEPNIAQASSLVYWTWREEAIQFLGALTDREVKIFYRKTLTPLTAANSVVTIPDSLNWLAIRVAQLTAKHIINSSTLAMEMESDVKEAADKLIRRLTKNMQGLGVRRQPYRGYGRRIVS